MILHRGVIALPRFCGDFSHRGAIDPVFCKQLLTGQDKARFSVDYVG